MKKWSPNETGYFSNEYQKILKKADIPYHDIKNIIYDAKDVLSKCINPNYESFTERLSSTNLVLGYIQSGKTTSMEAVACLARDNGFKVIVILSGHVSNLANQTKKRVYQSLNMYGWDRIDLEKGTKLDYNHTSGKLKNIISSQDNILLDNREKPSLLIVGMKHWLTIEKITKIFENAKENGLDLKKIPTLLIDDECDHHSLDTKFKSKNNDSDKSSIHLVTKDETLEDIAELYNIPLDMLKYLNNDLIKKNTSDTIKEEELQIGTQILLEKNESTTHRKIKRLRQSLDVHTFLGYTATPLANFLISTVNYLSPKSGTILKPGSLYTGANYFFGDKERLSKHIIQIEDDIIKSREKPASLSQAIRIFVIGVAFGIQNGDHISKKLRSMLIHPSMSVSIHEDWRNWTSAEILKYHKAYHSKALNIVDKKNRIDVTFEEIQSEFLKSYEELRKTESSLPEYNDQFIINISKALEMLKSQVIKFNADDGAIPFIKWGEDGIYARILVGGIGLERGYTIEGLTVSYIVRESGTDDTVYQRARFFGYHMNYVGLIRMYLPLKLKDNFIHQQEQEIIVRKKIQDVIDSGGNLKKDLRRSFPFINNPVRNSIISHNITKYPQGGTVVDNKAHHLDEESIIENRKIFNEILKSGDLINCSDITNHSYKNSLEKIGVIENLNLTIFTEKFLTKLNFFENSADDYNILIDLVEWWKMKGKQDLKISVMQMNNNERDFTREVKEEDFLEGNSRIPIESGANKNRPGHAYLHYEFLTNPESLPWMPTRLKDSPFGTPAGGKDLRKANKIATLQLYKFDILSKETGQPKIVNNFVLKDIPYFRLYIPKILGTGFLATEN